MSISYPGTENLTKENNKNVSKLKANEYETFNQEVHSFFNFMEDNPSETRSMMQAVSEQAILVRTNCQGIILDANDTFCQITGYGRDELIGRPNTLIGSGIHDSEFWKNMWQAISYGDTWSGTICNRKKNGELYWVQSRIAPCFSEEGNISGYFSIQFDITQRKVSSLLIDAERAALLEVARNGNLANACHTALEKLLPIDPRSRLSVFAIDKEKYLRHVASIGLSQDYISSIDGVQVGRNVGLCGAAAATGKIVIAGNIRHTSNWTKFEENALAEGLAACWSIPIKNGKDETVGTIAIYYPEARIPSPLEKEAIEAIAVTMGIVFKAERERKNIIKAKRAAEGLAEARRLLLSNMNHELRTPLNHIIGFSELLIGNHGDKEQLDEYLGFIKSAGNALLGKISKAIDIANAHTAVHKSNFDLVSFWQLEIEPYIAQLQLNFERTLSVEILAAEIPVFFCKKNLRESLHNIIDNSFKYTKNLDVINIQLIQGNKEGKARIVIEDKGIGMSNDFLKKAQEAFEVEDFSNIRKYDGLGLGLAAAGSLMRQSMGEMKLESVKGQGSTVTLQI